MFVTNMALHTSLFKLIVMCPCSLRT